MPTVAELLDALPAADEAAQPDTSSDLLRDLEQRLARKPVPTGSLRRLLSLGGLNARIALAYFAYWMRGWFQPQDQREQQLVETHLRAALKMFQTMSYLRGAVAKAGQAIASMPELVPDQFVETLGALHFQAPPMHYSLIREQLIDELGDDPENVFDDFETEAVAAALPGTGPPRPVEVRRASRCEGPVSGHRPHHSRRYA